MTSVAASLTVNLVDNVSKPARSVAQALKDAETKVQAIAKQMANTSGSDRFIASLSKLSLTKGDIAAVSNAWKDYARSANLAADASTWTRSQAADVRAWERQTIASIRAVTAERQAEGRAQARILQQEAAQMKAQAAQRARWFEGDRSLVAMAGAAAIGGGMAGAARDAYRAGATVQERIAMLRVAGARDSDIEESRTRFRDYAKTHAGVSESDWLASYKDAMTIAPGESLEFTELGARMRSALRNSGLSVSEYDIGNAMRAMDEFGFKTNGERESFLNNLVKVQQQFGGQVPMETYLSAIRNAKQSIYGWSPEFRDKYLPTVLQAMGEQGGTALMTAYNNYIGGHMSHAELKSLADDGFVRNQDMMINPKNGEIKGLKKGAKLFEADVFKSNILQWSWDFHEEYMRRKGSTEQGFEDLVAKMPRMMGGLVQFAVHNRQRLDRDAAGHDRAIGNEAADNAALAQNPIAGLSALTTSLEQFGAAVTNPMMTKAGEVLAGVAQGIQNIANVVGQFGKDHPELSAWLGSGAVAVGGVGGTALTLGAGAKIIETLFGGGFGLKGSAAALDASAAELTAAAVALRGGGIVPGAANPVRSPGAGGGLLSLLGGGLEAIEDLVPYALKGLGPVISALLLFREVGESLNPTTPEGAPYRTDRAWSSQTWDMERAQRSEREWRADPEAARGRAMLARDAQSAAGLDAVEQKFGDVQKAADAAHEAANAPIKPQVDASALDSFIAKLNMAQSGIAALTNAANSAQVHMPARVPSLGSTVRGNFTAGGVRGE